MMAYGFDTPASFGKFFPDCDMPEYWEHLEKRFAEMSAKGEAAHKFYADFKYDMIRDYLSGTQPIAEDLMPRSVVLERPYKGLGDVILVGLGIAVTAQVRALIEELEPGRHQFLPVSITLPSGEAYPVEYFTLRVLSVLDAWDREKSDPDCWKLSVRIIKMKAPKGDYAHGIAMKRSVIGDHHIWRGFVSPESGISGFNFYVSDRLKTGIDAAGLKTPPLYQLKEV